MPLIVQSTKHHPSSFNLSIINSQMQIATKRATTLVETKVAIAKMYQNGTTTKLSSKAQKATHALANYIYANKTSKKFVFVLGKDHQDQQLLLLTIVNHPAKSQTNVSLQKVIQPASIDAQKQEAPFLVKQLLWVTKALHKAEFGILFWIYQHRLSSQEALQGTMPVPLPIIVVNFQRPKTPHEQLQAQAWAKMMQVIHNLTSSQLNIHGDDQRLPSQIKITTSDIMLAIQNIITSDDKISKAASKLIKEANIEVHLDDEIGAMIITIKNYGNDKMMTIFGFKATGTPLEVARAKINAAQDGVSWPTKLHELAHGQTPTASHVNAPTKHGVTFKFKLATIINNKGESTLTYEVDVNPQVEGTTPQDVTFVVSGFETQAQATERITAQAQINAAQNKIDVAQNKIGVTAPTRLSKVFHGQTPRASDVNIPTKDGLTFKFKLATAINDRGESTLTYEVNADPQVEGTITKEATFIVSGFETKGQKDARKVIKKRLDTTMQNIRDGALAIPQDITTRQFDEYVQAMGDVYNHWGQFETTKFAEQHRAKITSLTIPSSFTSIGNWFRFFKKITSLSIPNSVTTIGAFVFENSPLTSLSLGNQLQTIGHSAFYSAQLKSLTIPNSVTLIGLEAFYSSPLTTLSLGNQLRTIGNGAFYLANLKALVIPNSVTAIGTNAFQSSPLTTLSLGEKIQTIEAYSFYSAKLKILTIPNSVTAIGNFAFTSSPLTTLSLGEKIQTIGNNAFVSALLTSLRIPNSVTTIGEGAFANSPLTNITIFQDVTFGRDAFKGAKIVKQIPRPLKPHG